MKKQSPYIPLAVMVCKYGEVRTPSDCMLLLSAWNSSSLPHVCSHTKWCRVLPLAGDFDILVVVVEYHPPVPNSQPGFIYHHPAAVLWMLVSLMSRYLS